MFWKYLIGKITHVLYCCVDIARDTVIKNEATYQTAASAAQEYQVNS